MEHRQLSLPEDARCEATRPTRRLPRVVLAVVWLLLFTAWFHSFGLPNNQPATRGMVWAGLPFDLLDLLDPPVVKNSAPWSWLFLAQRLPFLLIASLIWAGAWGLGSLLLRGLRLREDFDPIERTFFAGCLGLAAVSLMMLGFGLLGAMSRLLLGSLLLIPFAVEIRRARRPATGETSQRTGSCVPTDLPMSRLSWLVLSLIAPFVGCMLLGAMSPQTDFDVVEYHLGGPKEWFQQGHIVRLPHNVYTSFPFLTEMLLLCGMVLRGDWESGALAGQAAVAGFVPLTALGLFATGRRWFGSTAGSLAALVWLTTPWAYRIAIVSYAEGGLACYLFAAFAVGLRLIWRDDTDEAPNDSRSNQSSLCSSNPPREQGRLSNNGTEHRLLALCGLLAGSAMACKYTGAISVVLPLAVMIAIRSLIVREPMSLRAKRVLLELVLFGAAVLLAVGPWLVKNAVETGNPVFPLAYSVFGGEGRDAAMNAQWSKGHSAPPYLSVSHWLSDLFVKLTDVAANNDWHSALMFGLAPIAVLASWRRRVWCVWAFIGWQFFSWFVLTHHIDRFYVPMFPVVALLAGVGAAWLFTAIDGWPEVESADALRSGTSSSQQASMSSRAVKLDRHGDGRVPPSRRRRDGTTVGESAEPLRAGNQRRLWTIVADSLIVCLIGANVLYNVGVMINLSGYNAGRTDLQAARETQLSRWYGAQKWIEDELAAGRMPSNMKVLCVGEAALFHARFSYVYNTVFDRSQFEQWFARRTPSGQFELRPRAEILATLRQHRITHVLINWSEVLRYREPGSYGYTNFAHPDHVSELVQLGLLQPVTLPASVALQPLKEDRLKQVEEWAPALKTNVEGQPALTAIQLFE